LWSIAKSSTGTIQKITGNIIEDYHEFYEGLRSRRKNEITPAPAPAPAPAPDLFVFMNVTPDPKPVFSYSIAWLRLLLRVQFVFTR